LIVSSLYTYQILQKGGKSCQLEEPMKSRKLKEVMKKKNLKQRDLVRLTGLNKSIISETVNGSRWRLDELEIIARALQVTVEEISAAEEVE
jgi:transcriptional regulator with XRE-family HTH domain